MKMNVVILTTAALLVSGGGASAQQQYDSLGSPTPAPNQKVAPNSASPNAPMPSTTGSAAGSPTSGTNATTGADKKEPIGQGGVNGPVNTGTTTPTDPGAPGALGGLTPD